jgi:transcriptional regulator with XRE-family HTH domain
MGTIHDHAKDVSLGLGNRMLAMRQSRDWTLDRLADESGLSKAYLSRLEAGARQPSITALCAVAKALGVSIAALFEHPDETSACVIVRKGSVPSKSVNGLTYQPLSSSTKPFNLQPIEVTIPAHRAGKQVYQHEGEEWLFVVEGRLQVSIGNERYTLDTGDSAHFDSRQPHRLDAMDGRPARVLLVACPIPIALNPKRQSSQGVTGVLG